MPILTLQQRSRELGRIRIGKQVQASSGKMRPEKLDRFRVTSASQSLIQRIAELYGGEAKAWDNNGSPQWEVITTATRLPVLVPPQPVSQYFEQWSAGGCQRRCDGVTELLKDRPCVCGPDPEERVCKPTTRLNVVLRDVQGIGVWRLESHGYYSATELPAVAEFLARAGGYVSAWLSLEERTAVREVNGKVTTLRWMVPILEVDVTPAQLMAGERQSVANQIDATSPALDAAPPALPVGESKQYASWPEWIADVQSASTVEAIRELWRYRPAKDVPPDEEQVFVACAAKLRQAEEPESEPLGDADVLWQQVLMGAPEEWTVSQIEAHFTEITGADPNKATTADMQRYLDDVKTDQTSEGVQQ